jgi:uncharacterized membrane protein YhaH (DUF805 family)
MQFIGFIFSINGRVRRREFYLFVLVMAVIVFDWIMSLRDMARHARVFSNTATDGYVMNLLTRSDTHYATLALIVLIAYTVAAKRLHDRGKTGWWLLTVFVPVIGWAWLALELFILPGSPGDNRYGPHPTFAPDPEKEPLRIRYKR